MRCAPPRRSARSIALLGAVLAAAAPAAAHDFWVRPSRFAAAPYEEIDLRLFVGDGADVEELGRDPALVQRFEVVQGEERIAVAGAAASTPAGTAMLARPGTAIVVYESRHSFIELPAGRFESYLGDEGLEEVSFERQRRGEGLAPARESYARSCKALVRVGEPARGRDRPIGLPIELVVEGDPWTWHPGDRLAFRLLFEGRPLAGRQVKLIHLDEPALRLVGRSDLDGRIAFAPPRAGAWRAVAVHMQPARPGVRGDWESFWASLTLELSE